MSNSRLKSFIDRVLRLKEEEDTIKADIREVYAEMKGEGFDKTVAAGMQTETGRKALVAALDIMIEREEQGSSTVPQAPLSVDEKSRDAALPSVSAPSSGQE
ncbi:GapR family DNA-binding domain-containing protein [Brucella tritici]|uniref:GapR family DNA-binding domain-containing protein n=1 Tax=Brucella tritici TaxID=94626 RepID=UPI002000E1BC|nr:GapR family DNA-binding domain-containing protein [Brucella tritici]